MLRMDRKLAVTVSFLVFGSGCGGARASVATQVPKFNLEVRAGAAPTVPNQVPHQQLDQNSPVEVLEKLRSFVFGLKHVEEKQSRASMASARGAFIDSRVKINSAIKREFTHIHMEPGPGSQHLVLRNEDASLTIKSRWGVKHPWSDRLTDEGLTLVMVYAPRDDRDLAEIKKIVEAAWHLALRDG